MVLTANLISLSLYSDIVGEARRGAMTMLRTVKCYQANGMTERRDKKAIVNTHEFSEKSQLN